MMKNIDQLSGPQIYQREDDLMQESIRKAQIDINGLQKEVEHLTESINEIRTSNALTLQEFRAANSAILDKIMSIQQTLSEARGSWRALMWAAGVISGSLSLVYWLANHINWK